MSRWVPVLGALLAALVAACAMASQSSIASSSAAMTPMPSAVASKAVVSLSPVAPTASSTPAASVAPSPAASASVHQLTVDEARATMLAFEHTFNTDRERLAARSNPCFSSALACVGEDLPAAVAWWHDAARLYEGYALALQDYAFPKPPDAARLDLIAALQKAHRAAETIADSSSIRTFTSKVKDTAEATNNAVVVARQELLDALGLPVGP